jgi:hypothetical protein
VNGTCSNCTEGRLLLVELLLPVEVVAVAVALLLLLLWLVSGCHQPFLAQHAGGTSIACCCMQHQQQQAMSVAGVASFAKWAVCPCQCAAAAAAGHPGDGFTCPTPPCSPGVAKFDSNVTAPTEDGCKPCRYYESNGCVL